MEALEAHLELIDHGQAVLPSRERFVLDRLTQFPVADGNVHSSPARSVPCDLPPYIVRHSASAALARVQADLMSSEASPRSNEQASAKRTRVPAAALRQVRVIAWSTKSGPQPEIQSSGPRPDSNITPCGGQRPCADARGPGRQLRVLRAMAPHSRAPETSPSNGSR